MTTTPASLFRPVHVRFAAVATSTAQEIPLPQGARDIIIKCDPSTDWTWSTISAAAAATGMPMKAGESLVIPGCVMKTSLFVYQTSGVAKDFHAAWSVPGVR